ncbi:MULTISPECIES: hypothetical protein [Snodgrassella]|uniref:hypothetical protein n=1 Tax=Snodgrassella TaxID=1193515 RepID=UPI0009FFA19F|nr:MULTISPECIES: hypothetical protein [Snodgrassella]NUF09830.1 hypothetical protein [Snodgrassella sp. ESL0324]ORF05828.1 hypothetical protein BGH98_07940 [Snodgrassella alvi]ORF12149.1 hypothetical protein BGI01_07040 [Snodgrassella alvi]ORF17004.1 hypothetical protein BGI03_09345 [Snodgrassella alvi]ORF22711.1 hypothetical protein BGI04_00340 [Snodgrassella alvi]
METNRQTVILFRTKNTNYTYDTLYDYVFDSEAGNILEAVEFDGFTKFPLSATDIIDEADRYLYEEGYIDEENYYTERITPEAMEVLQKVLDLIAKNHNNDNLLINGRTVHTPIAILPEDIDYFNETKRISERLREWLNQVLKSSQKTLVAE